MAVVTAVRKKGTKTCAGCGGNVAGSASKCQNCGSTKLKKSLIIVRKVDADGDDANSTDAELEGSVGEDESEEDDELSEDDFEPADGDEDDEEEDDDDSEDEDAEEDDEDEDDEEEEPKVTKRIVRRRVAKSAAGDGNVNLDIALAALTVAEDISKAAEAGDYESDTSEYERAMHTFNNICDTAIESWANGDSIAKEDKAAKLKRLKAKLAELKRKAGMTDDDDVEKSDDEDIFKGLSPKAAAILRNAQEIQERDKVAEYENIAKSLGNLPTSETELGAALRHLSESDQNHYNVVHKALKAAAEASAQSDIFKSFGTAGPGADGDELDTIAKSLMEKNTSLTQEQAYAQALHANPRLYDQAISR